MKLSNITKRFAWQILEDFATDTNPPENVELKPYATQIETVSEFLKKRNAMTESGQMIWNLAALLLVDYWREQHWIATEDDMAVDPKEMN